MIAMFVMFKTKTQKSLPFVHCTIAQKNKSSLKRYKWGVAEWEGNFLGEH